MSEITVILDDRVRLVTAVLAMSQWPVIEQQQAPHAVHPHAKQTKFHLTPFADHPAIIATNQLLEAGVPLADLFTAALCYPWPLAMPTETLPVTINPNWVETIAAFHHDAGIAAFWADHETVWQEAYTELTNIITDCELVPFLNDLIQAELPYPTFIHPTIVYPMLTPVRAKNELALTLILPPAKAWGESPPWPFGEDPGWVIGQLCWQLTDHYLGRTLITLDTTKQALLKHAAVTLCLEREFDEAEGMSYMVRRKKEENLPTLPVVVESLRDYIENPTETGLANIVDQ